MDEQVLYTRFADKEDKGGLKPCYLMRERRAVASDPKTEYKADKHGRVFDGKKNTRLCAFTENVGV